LLATGFLAHAEVGSSHRSRCAVRVLVWYWGRRGGGAQFTASVIEALARRGDVELVASVSASLECLNRVTTALPTTRSFRLHPPFGLFGALNSLQGADVVLHTMVNPLSPIGRRVLGHTPVATVVHDATAHPGDEHWMMDQAVRRLVKSSAALIAPSQFVADQLSKRATARVTVIPLGPHLNLPDLWDPSGAVLFLGRFARYKGLDWLAEMWGRHPQRGKIALRIVGSGPEDEVDALRAVGADVTNRWIADNDLAAEIRGARLIVLPYLEASQSGVITLARSAKVPVLATNVGGLREQITDGGLCVERAEFEGSLGTLLSHPEMLSEMHEQLLRQPTMDQEWDGLASQLVDLLRTLLP
jgi:glycosyltransferase involved in cell wall biosynthesis